MISEKKERLAGSSGSSNTAMNRLLRIDLEQTTAITLGLLVAQGALAHVAQANGTLRRAVHEQVALARVKLRRCDHLRQLFHVRRLYVHNV